MYKKFKTKKEKFYFIAAVLSFQIPSESFGDQKKIWWRYKNNLQLNITQNLPILIQHPIKKITSTVQKKTSQNPL